MKRLMKFRPSFVNLGSYLKWCGPSAVDVWIAGCQGGLSAQQKNDDREERKLYQLHYNKFEMSWTANNSGQPPANQHDEHLRSFTLLNQTPNTIPMPSPVFNLRGRLNSVNSSFLSPMRLITSPTMNNDDLFEFQLKPADKEKL